MYTFPFVPFRYGKTATIGALILALCLIPSSEFNKLGVQITFGDFIVHFIMFFVFSAALCLDVTKKRKTQLKPTLIITIVVAVSFFLALFTELMQYLIIPLNRSGSFSDLVCDMLGSVFGAGLMLFIKRKSVPAF